MKKKTQKKKAQKAKKQDVYQAVTDRIIAALEAGTAPWRKPWSGSGTEGLPRNFKTGKTYRGINPFLLAMSGYESPYWLTFRQAEEKDGSVRKGEKGSPVVYWNWIYKDASGKSVQSPEEASERIPFLRKYTVFNEAQIDGIDFPASDVPERDHQPIAAAEKIVEGMPSKPVLEFSGHRACYSPALDLVRMPRPEAFSGDAEYYSTLFHELVHSTGHESRLARGVEEIAAFGSGDYSREELVAEMGAAFLAGHAGIVNHTIDNSAAYLQGWIATLKGDSKLAVRAAAAAQKAAAYILNVTWD